MGLAGVGESEMGGPREEAWLCVLYRLQAYCEPT